MFIKATKTTYFNKNWLSLKSQNAFDHFTRINDYDSITIIYITILANSTVINTVFHMRSNRRTELQTNTITILKFICSKEIIYNHKYIFFSVATCLYSSRKGKVEK